MKINKRSMFYNVFALTLSNIGLQILGFVYRIFLSRMTGAEGMGVYQLVFPYYSVVMAITLSGLTMAVSSITAEYGAFGDRTGARRVTRISLCIFFVMFACVALPTVLFCDWISAHLLGDARTKTALLIILPCLFCTGFENLFKNYFFGMKYVKPPIISELTEQIVRILAVAVLLLTFRPTDAGVSAALIVTGMVISEVVSALLLGSFYRRCAPRLSDRAPRCRQESTSKLCAKILGIAIPVATAGILNNLLNSANSVLIPRRLIDAGMDPHQAVADFGVLFGMTMPLLSLPIAFLTSLTVVIVPKLAEGMAVSNKADMKRKAGKAIHATSLLAFPAITAMIPLGATACTLLYQQQGAGEYMLPLCLATIFGYYQITAMAVLNGIGMQRRAAAFVMIGGAIQLAFTWCVGLPGVGMYGFIAGYIISSIVEAGLSVTCVVRRLGIRIRWHNWFVIPALSALLSGAVIRFCFRLMLGDGLSQWVSLLTSLGVGILVYLAALRIQGTSIPRYLKTLVPLKDRS